MVAERLKKWKYKYAENVKLYGIGKPNIEVLSCKSFSVDKGAGLLGDRNRAGHEVIQPQVPTTTRGDIKTF